MKTRQYRYPSQPMFSTWDFMELNGMRGAATAHRKLRAAGYSKVKRPRTGGRPSDDFGALWHKAQAVDIESQREDKRGHWPAGKRRSDIPEDLRLQFVRALHKVAQKYSLREIGRIVGHDAKNVSQWLKGERWPMKQTAREVLKILSELRAETP